MGKKKSLRKKIKYQVCFESTVNVMQKDLLYVTALSKYHKTIRKMLNDLLNMIMIPKAVHQHSRQLSYIRKKLAEHAKSKYFN